LNVSRLATSSAVGVAAVDSFLGAIAPVAADGIDSPAGGVGSETPTDLEGSAAVAAAGIGQRGNDDDDDCMEASELSGGRNSKTNRLPFAFSLHHSVHTYVCTHLYTPPQDASWPIRHPRRRVRRYEEPSASCTVHARTCPLSDATDVDSAITCRSAAPASQSAAKARGANQRMTSGMRLAAWNRLCATKYHACGMLVSINQCAQERRGLMLPMRAFFNMV
jgi:hypothetical protein